MIILPHPCYDGGMTGNFPSQLSLFPEVSWTEGTHLTAPKSGAKLRRWGTVQKACEILDDCDRETIYQLIQSGQVKGYKRNPMRPNSHYRVDLLSVWQHKHLQLAE